jgi:hypothetical protein
MEPEMPDKLPDVPLHTIQAIVTPDKFELGVHRIRLPGCWGYWLQPSGGAIVTFQAPLETPADLEETEAAAAKPLTLAEINAALAAQGKPPLEVVDGELRVVGAKPLPPAEGGADAPESEGTLTVAALAHINQRRVAAGHPPVEFRGGVLQPIAGPQAPVGPAAKAQQDAAAADANRAREQDAAGKPGPAVTQVYRNGAPVTTEEAAKIDAEAAAKAASKAP